MPFFAALLGLVSGCVAGDAAPGPSVDAKSCASGEIRDATGTCVAERCGPGPWPEGLAGPVAYVDPDGSDDGDGTVDAPFQTLTAAIGSMHAAGGGTVALGTGEWDEWVILDESNVGVDLVGRCPEHTKIRGSAGLPTITVFAGSRRIAGVGLSGEAQGLRVYPLVEDPVEIVLTDTHVHDVGGTAVELSGPTVQAAIARLEIADVGSAGGFPSWAFSVRNGAQVTAVDVEVRQADGPGVVVMEGADLSAESLTIERVAGGDEALAFGAYVWDASLTVRDAVITDVAGIAVQADGEQGVVELWRVEIDTAAAGGVAAVNGGIARISDSRMRDLVDFGTLADGGTVELEAVEIRDTHRVKDGDRGQALLSVGGGATRGTAVDVEGFGANAAIVHGQGSLLTLSDSRLAQADGLDEPALSDAAVLVLAGGRIEGEHVVIEDVSAAGLLLAQNLSTAHLRSSTIRGVRPLSDLEHGPGIAAYTHATVVLDGVTTEDVAAAAMLFGDHVEARLQSVLVEGVAPFAGDGVGAGLRVQDGSVVIGDHVEMNGTTGAAIVVSGASADLTSVSVEERGATSPGRAAVVAVDGAAILLRAPTLRGGFSTAAAAQDAGTTLIIHDGHFESVGLTDDGRGMRGVEAAAGARIDLRGGTMEGLYEVAALASGEGSVIDIEGTTIDTVLRTPWSSAGLGVMAQSGGAIRLTDTSLHGTEGPALLAGTGGSIVGEGLDIDAASFAAVAALGGTVDLGDFSIVGTTEDPLHGGGMAVIADGRYGWNRLLLNGGSIDAGSHTGFYLWGDGDLQLRNLDLIGAGRAPWSPGGIIATGGIQPWDGQEGLLISGVSFDEGPVPAVLLDGSGARFGVDGESSTNALPGVEPVRRQRCGDAPDSVIADLSFTVPPCAETVIPTQPVPEIWMRVGEVDTAR